jgi:hypothetical protein
MSEYINGITRGNGEQTASHFPTASYDFPPAYLSGKMRQVIATILTNTIVITHMRYEKFPS